jgi:hypothetical protein
LYHRLCLEDEKRTGATLLESRLPMPANKQTNRQTNKQTNKQTKQTKHQTNKQTNKTNKQQTRPISID